MAPPQIVWRDLVPMAGHLIDLAIWFAFGNPLHHANWGGPAERRYAPAKSIDFEEHIITFGPWR
jgi:hypothetical protein